MISVGTILMHLLTRVLATATLLGAITTTVVAQTTPARTQATPTHPNTKVYAYKKTAPANEPSTSPSVSPNQMAQDPDMPAYGSQKWWEQKNRWGNGEGGGP